MTVSPGALLRRGGFRDLSSIASADVGVQLLLVVSGPLAARMLGPSGRGQYAVASLLTLIASQLAMGGLPVAVTHYLGRTGLAARSSLRSAARGWWPRALLAAGAAAGTTGFALRHDLGSAALLLLMASTFVMAGLAATHLLLASALRGEGNVRLVNAVPLSAVSVYAALVAGLFFFAPTQLAGVIAGSFVLGQVIALVVGWRGLRDPDADQFDSVDVAELNRESRDNWFSSVSLAGLGLDHLVVGAVMGTYALGLFLVAATATNLSAMIMRSVGAMLLPRMAALRPNRAIALLRRWMVGIAFLEVGLFVAFQLIIGPVMRLAFGHEFDQSIEIARIMIVAWVFLSLRFPLSAALQAQANGVYASRVELITAILLVLGSGIGAALGGLEYVAWAQVVAGLFACAAAAVRIKWRVDDASPERAAADVSTTLV